MKIGVFSIPSDAQANPAIIARHAEDLEFASYWVPASGCHRLAGGGRAPCSARIPRLVAGCTDDARRIRHSDPGRHRAGHAERACHRALRAADRIWRPLH